MTEFIDGDSFSNRKGLDLANSCTAGAFGLGEELRGAAYTDQFSKMCVHSYSPLNGAAFCGGEGIRVCMDLDEFDGVGFHRDSFVKLKRLLQSLYV